MERIDADQHFWKYNGIRDSWITEDMSRIRRNFLLGDLEPLLKDNGFVGSVETCRFIPYFDTVMDAFGIDRILFGSDWPVCLVATEYKEVFDTVKNYFSTYAMEEQNKFFGQKRHSLL